MSLPKEDAVVADLERQFTDLFARADRVHSAAAEVLMRGRLKASQEKGHDYPTLMMVATLMVKACKTFRAIQITCEAGLGSDAAVLVRQLLETTVTVKFVLQKDSKTRAAMLGAHQVQRRLAVFRELAQSSFLKGWCEDATLVQLEAELDMFRGLIGTKVDDVKAHWSGKSFKWAAEQVAFGDVYAVMYRFTSAVAHNSDLGRHVLNSDPTGIPTFKLAPSDEFIEPVLNNAIALLAEIVTVANESFGLQEDDVVARIEAEVAPLHGQRV